MELTTAGYGAEEIALAKQVTDLTARMARSNYRDGLDELSAMKKHYGDQAWFKTIRGGYSRVLIDMDPEALLKNGIPFYDSLNIDWNLKPMDVLRKVQAPQLWLLAEKDREAPIKQTLLRLQQLQSEGKDINIRIFPESDHGMWLVKDENQIAAGYFDAIADYARGTQAKKPYGDSWIP